MNIFLIVAGIYGFSGALFKVIRSFLFRYNLSHHQEHFSGYNDAVQPDIPLTNNMFDLISFTLIGTGFLSGLFAAFLSFSPNIYMYIAIILEIVIIYFYGLYVYITVKLAINFERDRGVFGVILFMFYPIALLIGLSFANRFLVFILLLEVPFGIIWLFYYIFINKYVKHKIKYW